VNLDSKIEIEKRDKSSMGNLLHNFSDQCRQALSLGQELDLTFTQGRIKNIVITGLGGSGIGGDLIKSGASSQLSLPLYVNRGYHLPGFIDNETLVFVISYSGNTEETLSAFQEALEHKCKVVIVSSNGLLGTAAQEKNLPWVKLPPGYPPRAALGYLFFPIWKILARAGFIPEQSEAEEETIALLKQLADTYSITQPVSSNPAKQLAQKLLHKIPVIYGTLDNTDVVAYRWKCQLNENSKVYASYHLFPELNHNEIMGWEGAGSIGQQCIVIILQEKDDSERIKRRIEVTTQILQGKVAQVIPLYSQGHSRLARLYSLIYLGDYVSYYLALLRNIDPTPVRSIDYLKQQLGK
jgi:glucose/mannose-6-phosphate isomerase